MNELKNFNLDIQDVLEYGSIQIPAVVEKILLNLEETTENNLRMRNVTQELGMLLHLLVKQMHSKNIVEIGTANGYSTIWMGLAAENIKGANITTVEKIDERLREAKHNITQAGLVNVTRFIHGEGQKVISLINGPIDFLFLDILPEESLVCLKGLTPKMKSGSIVVCDNLLGHRDRTGSYIPSDIETDRYLSVANEIFSFSSPINKIGSGVHIGIK